MCARQQARVRSVRRNIHVSADTPLEDADQNILHVCQLTGPRKTRCAAGPWRTTPRMTTGTPSPVSAAPNLLHIANPPSNVIVLQAARATATRTRSAAATTRRGRRRRSRRRRRRRWRERTPRTTPQRSPPPPLPGPRALQYRSRRFWRRRPRRSARR